MNDDARRALAAIEEHGIVLLQDAKLPSVAVLIAGEPIRGSWWGHPAGGRIFHAAGELEHHGDVATFKLVEGKVCFVHRRLWPAIVAIGRARNEWQTKGLGAEAKKLLARVDAEGRVRATKKPAKELELRLLCASDDVHTESGAHATELISWDHFAKDREIVPIALEDARARIEGAVRAIAPAGVRARLPWQRR